MSRFYELDGTRGYGEAIRRTERRLVVRMHHTGAGHMLIPRCKSLQIVFVKAYSDIFIWTARIDQHFLLLALYVGLTETVLLYV